MNVRGLIQLLVKMSNTLWHHLILISSKTGTVLQPLLAWIAICWVFIIIIPIVNLPVIILIIINLPHMVGVWRIFLGTSGIWIIIIMNRSWLFLWKMWIVVFVLNLVGFWSSCTSIYRFIEEWCLVHGVISTNGTIISLRNCFATAILIQVHVTLGTFYKFYTCTTFFSPATYYCKALLLPIHLISNFQWDWQHWSFKQTMMIGGWYWRKTHKSIIIHKWAPFVCWNKTSNAVT